MVTATVDTQTKVTATAVVIMGTAIATTRVTMATATVVGATVTATTRRVEIAKSCRYRHQKVVRSIKTRFLVQFYGSGFGMRIRIQLLQC